MQHGDSLARPAACYRPTDVPAQVPRARPANTTVLAELVEPYMRVEIEVTARLSAVEQGRP